jgi:hypothetical protein
MVCATIAGAFAMPLAASGVKAEVTKQVVGIGNQHQRQSTADCTADFWLIETPAQSVGAASEPAVASLTLKVSLSCNPGVGYPIGSLSMTGGVPPVSCSGSFANFSGDSGSASCTLPEPSPGVYNAQAHVYAGLGGWVDFTWSSNEVVLPGTSPSVTIGTH